MVLKGGTMHRFKLRYVLALATHWVATSASATAMFMGLGDLPGGGFSSVAFGISADGG